MRQPAWVRTTSAVAASIQPAIERTTQVSQRAANIGVALLVAPAAFTAFIIGFWRLGQDVGWTGEFFIADGLFSHWQVWIALAVGLATLGRKLQSK
ncbi:MAG TPA: hypothetical protein VKU01_31215 [Bryobacteraceae bacterium]|nr:hypothetical protein [Bryobacteraceae bacterium]